MRSWFASFTCVCIATAALGVSTAPPTHAQDPSPDDRPNILVVVTDDQRVDTMSIMRRTRRWLGDEGVTFPNAYVTTPLCCPSRATIFSGRYAHNHGVHTNSSGSLLDADLTMQAYLQEAGYRTGLLGKYLLGVPLGEDPPHFDRWTKRTSLKFYGATWNINGRLIQKSRYDTTVLHNYATRFLRGSERQDDRPWFLYVTTVAPHTPSTPQKQYEDARIPPRPSTPAMHEDDVSDKPAFIQESPRRAGLGVRVGIRKQYRSLLSVDDMMHNLMKTLRGFREGQRTLVIFTSDNGYLWRDHGLRGKALPYLPAVNVPLYVRWPGRLPAGATDDRLVANIDIAPTVLDAAGVDPPIDLDGRSLLDTGWVRDRLLLEQVEAFHPAWDSLLTPDYQYTEWEDPDGAGTVLEYYDLVSDPWQLRNLFGDEEPGNDPVTAAIALQLQEDRHCEGTDNPPAGPPECP